MNKNEALKVQGFTALRKPQETTLDCLLAGQDAVCIMGTGSGKSAIFTTFALMQEQLVVVIEPHLALELDQVRLLRERDIAAAAINSMTGAKERRTILGQVVDGTLRLLYLTPEMAQNKAVKTALRKTQVAAVAVDEAHCVVKQGPGFREEYLTLPKLVSSLKPRPVIAAFTATATPSTVEQIISHLAMNDPQVLRQSVARDNLQLSAIEIGKGLGGRKDDKVIEQRKREEIYCRLKKHPKRKVVVYCNTVKRVKKLTKFLRKKGLGVESFYGACSDKAGRLKRFADGEVKVMVATNAFGLGVNIPDIRLVIHHSPSIGLDEYIQEAGRAGRDGRQAKAVLLWHPYDFTINRGLIEKAKLQLTGKQRKERLAALDALQAYAQDEEHCRWRMVRKFFGEPKGDRCYDQCDNCFCRDEDWL